MDILRVLRYQQYILSKPWNLNRTFKRSLSLAHKIYGPTPSENKNNIVVLHGLLGSKRNWDSLCRRINAATKATVIAADARNHGDSPHGNSHEYKDLAADASQLIKDLSINNAHVIGHSMGGRTAMVLALTEPSKVDSLMAVDISPVSSIGLQHDFFPRLVDAMLSVNFQQSDTLTKARNAARDGIVASGVVSNADGLSFITMNVTQLADKSYGWKCNLGVLKEYYQSIATFPPEMAGKQYSGPTIFIGGGQSDFLPPSDKPGIQQIFPKAELIYIDHVGHNAHAEDPNAFLKIVENFYSKIL